MCFCHLARRDSHVAFFYCRVALRISCLTFALRDRRFIFVSLSQANLILGTQKTYSALFLTSLFVTSRYFEDEDVPDELPDAVSADTLFPTGPYDLKSKL